jgi:hypothetical protein
VRRVWVRRHVHRVAATGVYERDRIARFDGPDGAKAAIGVGDRVRLRSWCRWRGRGWWSWSWGGRRRGRFGFGNGSGCWRGSWRGRRWCSWGRCALDRLFGVSAAVVGGLSVGLIGLGSLPAVRATRGNAEKHKPANYNGAGRKTKQQSKPTPAKFLHKHLVTIAPPEVS